MEKEEVEKIHQKLNFIANAYTTLHNEIIRKRLPEDDYVLNQISRTLHEISKIAHQFSNETKVRETFRMPDEFVELIGMMKFIAKRMDGIENRFKELEESDFHHNVKITIDSSAVDKFNLRKKPFDAYEELFSKLPENCAKALIMKYGVYEKPRTNPQIAIALGKGKNSIPTLIRKSLFLCRKSCLEDIVNQLPDGMLKSRILR